MAVSPANLPASATGPRSSKNSIASSEQRAVALRSRTHAACDCLIGTRVRGKSGARGEGRENCRGRRSKTGSSRAREGSSVAQALNTRHIRGDGRLPAQAATQARHWPRRRQRHSFSIYAARRRSAGRLAPFLGSAEDRALDRSRSLLRDPVVGAYHRTRPVTPLVSMASDARLVAIGIKAVPRRSTNSRMAALLRIYCGRARALRRANLGEAAAKAILAPQPRESGECLLNARHLDYQRLEVWN